MLKFKKLWKTVCFFTIDKLFGKSHKKLVIRKITHLFRVPHNRTDLNRNLCPSNVSICFRDVTKSEISNNMCHTLTTFYKFMIFHIFLFGGKFITYPFIFLWKNLFDWPICNYFCGKMVIIFCDKIYFFVAKFIWW